MENKHRLNEFGFAPAHLGVIRDAAEEELKNSVVKLTERAESYKARADALKNYLVLLIDKIREPSFPESDFLYWPDRNNATHKMHKEVMDIWTGKDIHV